MLTACGLSLNRWKCNICFRTNEVPSAYFSPTDQVRHPFHWCCITCTVHSSVLHADLLRARAHRPVGGRICRSGQSWSTRPLKSSRPLNTWQVSLCFVFLNSRICAEVSCQWQVRQPMPPVFVFVIDVSHQVRSCSHSRRNRLACSCELCCHVLLFSSAERQDGHAGADLPDHSVAAGQATGRQAHAGTK